MNDPNDLKNMQEDYWEKKLTSKQYNVLREKGTEPPFTGKFYNNFESGMYECAACGNPLFSSETKFNSDCGWPSFDKSLEGNVELHDDNSFGMQRIEVVCKNCGGHLGHLFNDGSTKTGFRYCINSLSLSFKPKK